MKIHSSVLARVLARTHRAVRSALFEVPSAFAERINQYEQLPPVAAAQTAMLNELFNMSISSKQRAIAGSMLTDHGVIPSSEYIEVIADSSVFHALQLWRQYHSDSVQMGITLLCRCYRVVEAEKLASATTNTPEICMSFIQAFAALRNSSKCDNWIAKLFECPLKSTDANRALRVLIDAKMWPQVQAVVQAMATANLKVYVELTTACILESQLDENKQIVAAMLSQDGSLVNSAKFRRAFNASDKRLEVAKLLDAHKFDLALSTALAYRGPHDVYLCYQVLEKWPSIPPPELLEKVLAFPTRNSLFVQFMLRFLSPPELWQFVKEHQLYTSEPKIHGPMSHANYFLLWRHVLRSMKSNEYAGVPVPLREFAVVTLMRCPLRPELIDVMVRCFKNVPDLPAVVCVVEYAGNSGIYSDWQHEAQQLCEPCDLNSVLSEAEPLRAQIQ